MYTNAWKQCQAFKGLKSKGMKFQYIREHKYTRRMAKMINSTHMLSSIN